MSQFLKKAWSPFHHTFLVPSLGVSVWTPVSQGLGDPPLLTHIVMAVRLRPSQSKTLKVKKQIKDQPGDEYLIKEAETLLLKLNKQLSIFGEDNED